MLKISIIGIVLYWVIFVVFTLISFSVDISSACRHLQQERPPCGSLLKLTLSLTMSPLQQIDTMRTFLLKVFTCSWKTYMEINFKVKRKDGHYPIQGN